MGNDRSVGSGAGAPTDAGGEAPVWDRARRPVRSFRDLQVRQRAHALADAVYDIAEALPDLERFAVASRIRRASTSICGNIAEGYGTGTRPGFLRHLRIARGSFAEPDAHLGFIRHRRPAPVPDRTASLTAETGRLLQALISSLERSERAGPQTRRR